MVKQKINIQKEIQKGRKLVAKLDRKNKNKRKENGGANNLNTRLLLEKDRTHRYISTGIMSIDEKHDEDDC